MTNWLKYGRRSKYYTMNTAQPIRDGKEIEAMKFLAIITLDYIGITQDQMDEVYISYKKTDLNFHIHMVFRSICYLYAHFPIVDNLIIYSFVERIPCM